MTTSGSTIYGVFRLADATIDGVIDKLVPQAVDSQGK